MKQRILGARKKNLHLHLQILHSLLPVESLLLFLGFDEEVDVLDRGQWIRTKRDLFQLVVGLKSRERIVIVIIMIRVKYTLCCT